MQDSFQRVHNYLRVSLTDNCNLRCFYCMPDEEISCTPQSRLMTPDEIYSMVKTFCDLGVTKVRLTGGEPLVRKQFAEILGKLSQLPVELTITTNGILLDRYLPQIIQAGIRSLNISLDTLDRDKFQILTRRDEINKVKQNIRLCLESGLHVKINMVVMKGLNDHELKDFVQWSIQEPVHVRFIEFMPFSGNQWHHDKVFPMDKIIEQIAGSYEVISLGKEPHATARKFFVAGSAGSFAVISTMSHPFCGDCNRLRLTADGKLRNCLFATGETDLLTPLRAGEELVPLIISNIRDKKAKLGGQFDERFDKIVPEELQNRSMIAIGG